MTLNVQFEESTLSMDAQLQENEQTLEADFNETIVINKETNNPVYVTVTETDTGVLLTVTDNDGEQSVAIKHGEKGEKGASIASITSYYARHNDTKTLPKSFRTTVPETSAYWCYIWSYDVITLTDGTTLETEKRIIGVHGKTGANGTTPEKGTDYWTNSDKQEIIDAVLTALPSAEGVSF